MARNALFVTVILIANQFLWLSFVRPAVYNRFVTPDKIYHPAGMQVVYLQAEWIACSLITATLGVYVLFFWLRRQLQSVVNAARLLGEGRTPPRLPETGAEEVRQLSTGFNQLASNLEALEADRRMMLVGISHDLSTPLTRLRLALELSSLKGDLSQTPGMIHDVEEMSAILAQFTDFVRSGKEEDVVATDFNQIVADTCARYNASGAKIDPTLAPIPLLDGRPLALRRLATNLIDNAVRYAHTDVQVSTKVEGKQLIFSVTDRGPGIRTTDPNALVKPFAREDLARGGPSGAGLGLSIVERIARLHGGELQLVNRTGGGLAAIVALPCST
ncbi:MAG TPA: ATP-binding protein [Rudaea sp.]|nr:ATP-binding protein [Rudaea sp.]